MSDTAETPVSTEDKFLHLRANQLEKEWKEQNIDQHEVGRRYADLENDHKYVVELNRAISVRYDELFNVLPNVEECTHLIKAINEKTLYADRDEKTWKERLSRLLKLRSAAVMIEKHDAHVAPIKYDDLAKEDPDAPQG